MGTAEATASFRQASRGAPPAARVPGEAVPWCPWGQGALSATVPPGLSGCCSSWPRSRGGLGAGSPPCLLDGGDAVAGSRDLQGLHSPTFSSSCGDPHGEVIRGSCSYFQALLRLAEFLLTPGRTGLCYCSSDGTNVAGGGGYPKEQGKALP